jgi:hypothetical protein
MEMIWNVVIKEKQSNSFTARPVRQALDRLKEIINK